MRRLAIIPAKSSSSGLPNKNVRLLGGKPLFEWSVEVARSAGLFDAIVVSSDDMAILKRATELKVLALKRPDALCSGLTTGDEVCEHAVKALKANGIGEFGVGVMLNPTQPFRSPKDVQDAVALLEKNPGKYQSALSVSRITPIVMSRTRNGKRDLWHMAKDEPPIRQLRKPIFVQNGVVYAFTIELLLAAHKIISLKGGVFVTPKERSLDIDDIWDFRAAEGYLAELLASKGQPEQLVLDGELVQPVGSGTGLADPAPAV